MPDAPVADMAETIRGRTALVTGGAGFIGSHLADRLLALGAQVHVLDDLSSGYRANVPDRATFIEGSILDSDALAEAAAGCTLVFHEAAMVSVPESVDSPRRCFELNVVGTQRVLDAARRAGARRVVFASSAAVYGDDPDLPCREDAPVACVSPYAASKAAGEHLIQSYAHCYGLEGIALRYFNIFGPRQDPASPYAAVISTFADRLRQGETITMFGDGGHTRDFTAVENVVNANLLAAVAPAAAIGRVFNIGTGRRVSLLELLEVMTRVLDLEVTAEHGPDRPGDVRDSVADISRARTELGYAPSVALEEGLTAMLAG